MPAEISFLSVRMRLASKQEALGRIDAATAESPVRIATVNPEFMLEAGTNLAFRNSLEAMDICTLDGSGLMIMLGIWKRLSQTQFATELYHGSDMVADLFERYQDGSKRFFFLGGRPGMAEQARKSIEARYPGISITGTNDGGAIDRADVQVDPALVRSINDASPDILLVGFGAPKQEIWIQRATGLSVPVAVGIGGSLDFYSQKKRAPRMMRTLHLEWLWRSLTEPGHARRAWRAVVVFSIYSLVWMGKRLATRGKLER